MQSTSKKLINGVTIKQEVIIKDEFKRPFSRNNRKRKYSKDSIGNQKSSIFMDVDNIKKEKDIKEKIPIKLEKDIKKEIVIKEEIDDKSWQSKYPQSMLIDVDHIKKEKDIKKENIIKVEQYIKKENDTCSDNKSWQSGYNQISNQNIKTEPNLYTVKNEVLSNDDKFNIISETDDYRKYCGKNIANCTTGYGLPYCGKSKTQMTDEER